MADRVHLPIVTNSECTTYRRCPREHHFRFTLGIAPLERAESLQFGTAIHEGLEAIWHGGEHEIGIWADWAASERARAMLDGYVLRWPSDAYDVLGVEMQFDTALVNPATGEASDAYRLAGKLDALVRDDRGDVWIVEHKTSSDDIVQGSPYWAKLRLDSQVSTYMVGARALGYEPRGVIYDVLGKPRQRPLEVPIVEDGAKVVLDANGARVRTKDGKKWRETGDAAQGFVLQTRPETREEYGARVREAIASDPDAFYQRGVVVRLADEEREAAEDTWQIVQRIDESRRTGIAPRNPDACSRFGRMCGYFAVCTRETTLDNPLRYTHVDNVHPELELETAAQ